MLQQYAVLFPTGQIAIGMLAIGAIVGIGVPVLTHLLATHGHGAAKGATPPPIVSS